MFQNIFFLDILLQIKYNCLFTYLYNLPTMSDEVQTSIRGGNRWQHHVYLQTIILLKIFTRPLWWYHQPTSMSEGLPERYHCFKFQPPTMLESSKKLIFLWNLISKLQMLSRKVKLLMRRCFRFQTIQRGPKFYWKNSGDITFFIQWREEI